MEQENWKQACRNKKGYKPIGKTYIRTWKRQISFKNKFTYLIVTQINLILFEILLFQIKLFN